MTFYKDYDWKGWRIASVVALFLGEFVLLFQNKGMNEIGLALIPAAPLGIFVISLPFYFIIKKKEGKNEIN